MNRKATKAAGDEQDDLMQALRQTCRPDASPELEKRMRGYLQGFRQDLREHPYVRKLARGRVSGPWAKLGSIAAGMAAVCLVAFVAWLLLSGNGPTRSAYAALMEAVESTQKAEWLHTKGKVAGEDFELWLSLHPFRGFVRRGDRVEGADEASQRAYEYDPAARTLTVKYMDEVPREVQEAENYLAVIMRGIERAQREHLIEISTSKELVLGRTHTVYSITKTDVRGETRLIVDESSRRIVRMESSVAKGPLGPGPFAIEFDYPETGPTDIYAAGVPRDAEVVDQLPSPDLLQLHQRIKEARERFAPTYHAIMYWGDRRRADNSYLHWVLVAYKKNGRYRIERYTPAVGTRAVDISPDDVAALEAWIATRPVREVYFGGPYESSEATSVTLNSEGNLEWEKRFRTELMVSDKTVEHYTWSWPPSRKKGLMLPPKDGPSGRLIGQEQNTQGLVREGDIVVFPTRTRRYWNPRRDYVQEEVERLSDVQAPWQKDKDWMKDADPELIKKKWLSAASKIKEYRSTSTERVIEYGQTKEGQWYAKKIMKETRRNTGSLSPTIVVIHLDTERDIPDERLDPDSITAEMFRAPKGQSVTD